MYPEASCPVDPTHDVFLMTIQTRASLLLRLHDPADAVAWSDFASIYEPVIYRLARSRGLQDADAREVTQEVLLAVAGAIQRFDPTKEARFSGWLATVTRNATIDRLRRQRERGSGQTDVLRVLQQVPEPQTDDTAEFDFQHRQQLFRWAAEQVRDQVQQSSWQAFWMTAVQGEPAGQVAQRLAMSVGAVYVARCRVLARIKAVIAEAQQ